MKKLLTLLALALVAWPCFAIITPANVTVTAADLQMCDDGNYYTVCPPAPADAIPSASAVTYPLSATGSGIRIDVGGGNNDMADLSTLDPSVLTPGSVVNIFYRVSPYQTKMQFHTDGTEANPIRVHGVTDASGNQPVIDCNGATTNSPAHWSMQYGAPYGCWNFSYSRAASYSVPTNDGPSWYEISNITIQNARSTNTFDGGSAYVSGVAGLRISNGAHIKVIGMRILNNENGIFSASNYVIDHVELRGNYLSGNGASGNYLVHNVYLQAVSSDPQYKNIVEGNYFGPLTAGALGLSGTKMRGTDFIYRYNTVICWQRCLDIVEAQDELPNWIYSNFTAQQIIDRYHTVYVYGNTFKINESNDWISAYGIHCGMDTGTAHPSDAQLFGQAGSAYGSVMARCSNGGKMYFYHNSIHGDVPNSYRSSFFDMDAGGSGQSTHPGTIEASNNVWQYEDALGTVFMMHARNSGNVIYSGVNHANMPNAEGGTIYEGYDLSADNPSINITGGTSPTFVATYNSAGDPLYTLTSGIDPLAISLALGGGSPALGVAGALPAATAAYPVQLQPMPGGGAAARASTSNIGAHQ